MFFNPEDSIQMFSVNIGLMCSTHGVNFTSSHKPVTPSAWCVKTQHYMLFIQKGCNIILITPVATNSEEIRLVKAVNFVMSDGVYKAMGLHGNEAADKANHGFKIVKTLWTLTSALVLTTGDLVAWCLTDERRNLRWGRKAIAFHFAKWNINIV